MTADNEDPHLFEFDLDKGIRDQAVECLDASPMLQLEKNVAPNKSGVYAIYHKGVLVYVGKASRDTTRSKRDLRARLNEHVSKINGRKNIRLKECQCKYLTFVSEWWVFAAEYALITHFTPAWNLSGFGSKTPGRGRPGTERTSRWDADFPPA